MAVESWPSAEPKPQPPLEPIGRFTDVTAESSSSACEFPAEACASGLSFRLSRMRPAAEITSDTLGRMT